MLTLTKTRHFIHVSQLQKCFVQVRCKDIRDNFGVELLETKYQRERQFPKDYTFHSHSARAYEIASSLRYARTSH